MFNDSPRVADYFVTVGLNELNEPEKDGETLEPITDLAVIFKSLGEEPPPGYKCIEFTPSGFPADLNHGSFKTPSCYLCFKRGRDKPPLTDIGVLYEGKQHLMHGCGIVHKTPTKQVANVNNANNMRIFITYRQASPQFAHSSLAVIDIAVIIKNKGEKPPHAFCMIERSLNQGLVGSEVYLCYRKSLARSNSLSYPAEIISRYPFTDYEGYPLPDSVSLFCLPLGVVIESWPETAQIPLPIFSTFALTAATGEKIYGAGVTFFEELVEEKFTKDVYELIDLQQKNHQDERLVAQTNKCICLLSRYPFFDAFRRFLMSLYRLTVSGTQNLPIERYISHFMHNIPFPTPQKPIVYVQITHEGFEITEPSQGPIPTSGASFISLLRCLGTEISMVLLYCILTEQKILVHSLRPALLTSVCEALTSLIFPFQWKCPYIPLCPLKLADVLFAPFPFIYGVDSRYFDQSSPPNDVTCVDLDTAMITQATEKNEKPVTWRALPKKPGKMLKDKLDQLFDEVVKVSKKHSNSAVVMPPLNDLMAAKNEKNIEMKIQEAFLRFHAQILKGYKQFLLPIISRPDIGSRDLTTLFDLDGFGKSRPRGTERFFQLLTKTQLFSHFIESRSLSSGNDAVLAFFDECCDRCEISSQLIRSNIKTESPTTVVVTPPDRSGLPADAQYFYNSFPKLRAELFSAISPVVKSMQLLNIESTPPRSPIVGRTVHERQQGSVSAKKQANIPRLWARCLLGHCYTLWFIHLPAYVNYHHKKSTLLYRAFEVLQKIGKTNAKLPDEVCYRVLMQLSGQFDHPALAVKTLFEMKRVGNQPNAVTWGYYHKAVLEGQWVPEKSKTSPVQLWCRLRLVVMAVSAFRKAITKKSELIDVGSENLEDKFDSLEKLDTTTAPTDTINTTSLSSSITPNTVLVDLSEPENSRSPNVSGTVNVTSQNFMELTDNTTDNKPINTKPTTEFITSKTSTVDMTTEESLIPIETTSKGSSTENSTGTSTGNVNRAQPIAGGLAGFSSDFPDISSLSSGAETNVYNQTSTKTGKTKNNIQQHLHGKHYKNNPSLSSTNSDDFIIRSNLTKHSRNISDTSISSNLSDHTGSGVSQSVTSSWDEIPNSTTSQQSLMSNGIYGMVGPSKHQRNRKNVALEAVICSCQICGTCEKAIYDEEVMAAWSADDSNLNIICPFCTAKRVPSLHITIKDYRASKVYCSTNSLSSNQSIPKNIVDRTQSNPINTVTSHSPLVDDDPLGLFSEPMSSTKKEPRPNMTSSSNSLKASTNNMDELEQFLGGGQQITKSTTQVISKPLPINTVEKLSKETAVSNSAPSSSSSSPVLNSSAFLNKHRKTSSTCSEGLSTISGSCDEKVIQSVPYLSPLVLRKELENLLSNSENGSLLIQTPTFVEEKPILYWNLVWYFRRLGLHSHLPLLLLQSYMEKSEDSSQPHGEVLISTSWDTDRQRDNFVPLYQLWNLPADKQDISAENGWTPKSMLTSISAHVQNNDVVLPLKILLDERTRQQQSNPEVKWSIYRELMFLSLVSCGMENIDLGAFDREYKIAYREITKEYPDKLYPDDKLPSPKAIFCRMEFNRPKLQRVLPRFHQVVNK